MDVVLLTVIGIVVVALLFDYANGFHDSANSISTIVATGVLRPRAGGAVGGLLQLHRVRVGAQETTMAQQTVPSDLEELRQAVGLEQHEGTGPPRR